MRPLKVWILPSADKQRRSGPFFQHYGDYFRCQDVFPIYDIAARKVGFTGRRPIIAVSAGSNKRQVKPHLHKGMAVWHRQSAPAHQNINGRSTWWKASLINRFLSTATRPG
jgi:hypothetical protein